MSISPARLAAYEILRSVEERDKYAVDLLQGPRLLRMKEADRKLATEIVMGVLRWRGDLDFQAQRLSGRPPDYFDAEVREILRMGIFQIRYLSGIPKSAAVNESAELVKHARKKSAVGLVNAVLRKCETRDLSRARSGPEYVESARRSIPSWLIERWERQFGASTARSVVLASQSVPQTHLRVRGPAGDLESVQRELGAEGVQTRTGSFMPRALRVQTGSILSSAAWRAGRVVIQDEASQIVASFLHPEPGQGVLDLCAAPGIKTAQTAEELGGGTIIACDRSLRRLRTVGSVVPLPEAAHLHRVVLDAARPLPFSDCFSRILIDAPCSGTGTLARNPEIKWRLRPEHLAAFAERQARVLRQGLDSLAPEGRLVYSTCSLEPEENEGVILSVLRGLAGFHLLSATEMRGEFPAVAPLIDDAGFFRSLPGVQDMDGFFAAVIVAESSPRSGAASSRVTTSKGTASASSSPPAAPSSLNFRAGTSTRLSSDPVALL